MRRFLPSIAVLLPLVAGNALAQQLDCGRYEEMFGEQADLLIVGSLRLASCFPFLLVSVRHFPGARSPASNPPMIKRLISPTRTCSFALLCHEFLAEWAVLFNHWEVVLRCGCDYLTNVTFGVCNKSLFKRKVIAAGEGCNSVGAGLPDLAVA